MTITPMQCLMARGGLRLSRNDLAKLSGVASKSIDNFENGETSLSQKNMAALTDTFIKNGIEFIGETGVNVLQDYHAKTLTGADGFKEFLDDVYNTVKNGGVINVTNVVDQDFKYWAGDKHTEHVTRMANIKSLECKTLCKEGYKDFVASDYTHYRWLPEEDTGETPFYMYGNKLAILSLRPEPVIIIINVRGVVETFRIQFDSLWEKSISPTAE